MWRPRWLNTSAPQSAFNSSWSGKLVALPRRRIHPPPRNPSSHPSWSTRRQATRQPGLIASPRPFPAPNCLRSDMSENFDINDLLQQAMAMQSKLAEAQEQAAHQNVEGSAGAGKVAVTMSGAGEITKVRIDPSIVDPEDVALLEDLILAA